MPLAILSEGTPTMLRAVLSHNGLTRHFRQVVSADEVCSYKPAAPPYRELARRLGIDTAQLLFVTAHGWDVAGAKASGFQTAWLNRQGESPECLGTTPDLELRSLAKIPGDKPAFARRLYHR